MRAGVTLYSGLRHSGYRRDDTPGAIPLGGFRHLDVLYAKAMGTRADCVSSTPATEQDARSFWR
jgi:D-arabinose 1-dehydrogenase-like Zn-dependent alcohol dehydrogenase